MKRRPKRPYFSSDRCLGQCTKESRFGRHFGHMVELVRRGHRLSPQSSISGKSGKSGLALAGTIGGYVAICIAAGLVLGLLIDHVLRTAPLFLIAGVVLGFIVSFFVTYKLAMGELGE